MLDVADCARLKIVLIFVDFSRQIKSWNYQKNPIERLINDWDWFLKNNYLRVAREMRLHLTKAQHQKGIYKNQYINLVGKKKNKSSI